MAIGDIIVCLDVGASKVSCIVGQVNKFSEIEVIGYGLCGNEGVKKGLIYNPSNVAKSIKKAIEDAEEIAGLNIKSAYLNIKGMNVRIERVSMYGQTENPDDGLSYNDIFNLYKKIQLAVEVQNKEQIIDIMPYTFYVNERPYKQEPIGAFCKQFTLDADVVIGEGEYIAQLVETMKLADISIDGLILETLATSNVVLMPEEKKIGALMLDIGAGHTDISVYKEDRLEFYTTLPVGADHITNDIAIGLDISTEEAEKLKRQYNLAIEAMIANNHDIKLNTVQTPGKQDIVKCSDIVKIMECRITEIYQIIRRVIAENNLLNKIDCVVITGQGVSNIVGIEELAVLNLKINQVRICSPKLINVIKPQHTTAFGMVRYIANLGLSKHVNSNVEIITDPTLKDKIVDFFSGAKNKVSSLRKKVKKDKAEENEYEEIEE